MEKEFKIIPPEGYEIDKENSTFDCIKFRPITKRWRDDTSQFVRGWYIAPNSNIGNIRSTCTNTCDNYNVFATEKQAKSALAMARISQIMANDERFGGIVTDEEWVNDNVKYILEKYKGEIYKCTYYNTYHLLAFHTKEQRSLFLKENEDLIRQYFMID